MGFLSKILTFGEGKQLKQYQNLVQKVGSFEPAMKDLSDEELAALTSAYRTRYANGESLDSLLPEAFATVREAGWRTLGMRHFDVQLIGGMALHDGQIAEMKTGEGKTLVSTLAGYLNAIPGKGVHVVTVNDYLAKRDSEWMGRIYRFLGMEVGLIQNGMSPKDRIPAYQADVTYGTNAEFGFDYLRDNMVKRAGSRVQRGHSFAIVDEVDSILIDEARTPLIISGAGIKAADTYKKFARAMLALSPEDDFILDEAKRTIVPTEVGLAKIEARLGIEDIYADTTGQLANHLQQALRAQYLFKRDVDYVVVGGEVKIVDEFTGRIMEGRRYSEGLHQALEAKENVRIREENQTLATITLQNYFRLYDKLSGMTGTAMTEDAEFRQIYNLPVVAIPPNKPVARVDNNDLVYRTIDAKFKAVADDVARRHQAQQPVLVGTVSIETSERLSRALDKRGIPHETLNAKNHEREAHIVAQAGRLGAVTIATNMAGRGTDILLGGNAEVLADDLLLERGIALEEATDEQRQWAADQAKAITKSEHDQVVKAGGLAVIGTERHESRRIDNQLRGRSGRQGDPGETQFYLSLEDDLMRLFGGDRMDSISRMMEKTEIDDDMPLQAGMVSKAIESAQRQVEAMHFSARKNVLEYDDVMNRQRSAIYQERNAILDGKDLSDRMEEIASDCAAEAVALYCPSRSAHDDWDVAGLNGWVTKMTRRTDFDVAALPHDDDPALVERFVVEYLMEIYQAKRDKLGDAVMTGLQSQVMLNIIDVRWMNHLQSMDYLKTGIGLRAFGQRDPLVEYKEEAHRAFSGLISGMYETFLRTLLCLEINEKKAEEQTSQQPETMLPEKVSYSSPEAALEASVKASGPKSAPRGGRGPAQEPAGPSKPATFRKDPNDPYANCKVNDPCPCGSGLKFKKCHGKN